MVHEALQGFCEENLTPTELLSAVGLPSDILQVTTGRVPVPFYGKLWRRLARRYDDEFFGMDPRGMRSGSFEFLCRAGMSQPTVGAALTHGLAFLNLMFERLQGELMPSRSLAEIILREPQGPPNRAFAYFTYWMIVHGVACWLAGRRIPLLAVELRCEEPAFTADYRVMFSDNLRFNQNRTRIIFAASALDLPVRRSEPDLQRFLAEAPCNILEKYRDSDSLASRIKTQLRLVPGEHWPTSEVLVQTLCMSPATLRRRLAERGQSYQAIKDAVRKERAIDWLAEPAMSYSDIASQLGFADISSFYKAFRKWTGTNPGHYRNLILAQTDST
nr:AraC family transcriptional regulator [Pseudomonas duriflava]